MRHLIRKAGQAVRGMPEVVGNKARQMDDAYAQKVADMYLPDNMDAEGAGAAARGIGAAFLGGVPLSSMGESPATNVAAITGAMSRYAAPAAGISLAGKGLMDLAVMLDPNEQTSGTLMP